MSNAALSQQIHDLDDHEWNHILHQMEQQWPIREKVSTALKEANAAFAAQFTQPDAYKYMEACGRFAEFLNLKLPMDDSEQKFVLQILQIACAMHEIAVNNHTLTATERSSHQLASTSLVAVCKSAVETGITNPELWCQAFDLSHRAHQALSRAADALNLCKYLDIANMPNECFFSAGSSSGAAETDTASPPVSPSPRIFAPKPRMYDINDIGQSPLLVRAKEKTFATLQERPKSALLGRANTMRSPTQTAPSNFYSPTRTTRAYSRRGPGLSALPEEE